MEINNQHEKKLNDNKTDIKVLSLKGLFESADLSIVNLVVDLFENDSNRIVQITAGQTLGNTLAQNRIPSEMESKILKQSVKKQKSLI